MVLRIVKGWRGASGLLHDPWGRQQVLLWSEEAYDDSNRNNNKVMSMYMVPGIMLSSI